jgi:DNA-3-methyladenine glycosylase I
MIEYHDTEWGVPSQNQIHLFEHIVMEIFQAGLNWLTILKKRDNFRQAFAGFDPEKIVKFSETDFARIMADPGIIRNRLKISAAIHNAGPFLETSEKFDGFHNFLYRYRPENPIIYRVEQDIPSQTSEAEALAKEMKKLGFKFIGPTSAYAYMQSIGIVNDHIESCHRFAIIERMRNS